VIAGVLECWSAGVLECWSAGVLECWSAGVLECWSAGVLECWTIQIKKTSSEVNILSVEPVAPDSATPELLQLLFSSPSGSESR